MLKEIFKNGRVITLVIFLVVALFALRPSPWNEGVAIRSVAENSTAALAGIQSPAATVSPLSYERIIQVNDQKITTVEDYHTALVQYQNASLRIITDKASYVLKPTETVGLQVVPSATSNIRKGLDLAGGSRVVLKT